jgi:transcriptional regulator with XRE-family HTH domain
MAKSPNQSLGTGRPTSRWPDAIELAEIAGTTQAVTQKIENGRSLRPRTDEDFARALNVPIEWLRCGVVGVEADLEQARQAGYTER